METVVVGVGDLDKSRAALDFATEEAVIRGARLRIVHGWDIAPRPGKAYSQVFIANDMEELERQAQRTASLALEHAARLAPGLRVESKAVFGDAAENLIDEAKTALEEGNVLLVVEDGSRGRIGARFPAHRLLRRAPCPVAIVPAGRAGFRCRPPRFLGARSELDALSADAGRPGPADRLVLGTDYSMLSLADIAKLGKVDQDALRQCVREDPQFPKPVVHLSTGDLYDRHSIYKWAIEAGLKALEPAL